MRPSLADKGFEVPIVRESVAEIVFRRILDMVKSGVLKPGDALPPERDLAVSLNVSRPSVREALIALEVEGLVEVRMGSGIYVQPRGAGSSRGAVAESESPLETILARQLIEGELAAQAALVMKAEDIAGLHEAPDVMRGRLQGVFTVVVTGGPRLGDLYVGLLALTGALWFPPLLGGLLIVVLVATIVRVQRTFRRYDALAPTP